MQDINLNEFEIQKIIEYPFSEMSNVFTTNTFFKFTGADEIKCNFKEGQPFQLTFHNRGEINGNIIAFSLSKIILEWNVKGFNREDENQTIVEINLIYDSDFCILKLKHSLIPTVESANIKYIAWTELLENLNSHLQSK